MTRPTQPARSELRLADLKARRPVSGRLMNVKIPVDLADAIDKLARGSIACLWLTESPTTLLPNHIKPCGCVESRKSVRTV